MQNEGAGYCGPITENVIVKQQKSFWKYSRRGGSPHLLRQRGLPTSKIDMDSKTRIDQAVTDILGDGRKTRGKYVYKNRGNAVYPKNSIYIQKKDPN